MMLKTLGECGVDINSGQIMTRLRASAGSEQIPIRVILPKAIHDGAIYPDGVEALQVKKLPDEKKIARKGNIIVKLSTPYDSAIVTDEFDGAVIPSFCAIISSAGELDSNYLRAFFASEYCKRQLEQATGGTVVPLASIGQIKELRIPVASADEQKEIGARFDWNEKRAASFRVIQDLEARLNDKRFEIFVNEVNEA